MQKVTYEAIGIVTSLFFEVVAIVIIIKESLLESFINTWKTGKDRLKPLLNYQISKAGQAENGIGLIIFRCI